MITKIITISKPVQINSQNVKNTLKKWLESGVKTSEIALNLAFITDDEQILFDRFKVLKNQIALKVRCDE